MPIIVVKHVDSIFGSLLPIRLSTYKLVLNKNQDNFFHSDQHVLLWLQNSHVLVDWACLMVVILSQTIFSMETFKIFSNLAIISNKGMLNRVIAVITANLGHFDDHGNQLTTGKDFSSDRTLRVHLSDTSFVFLLLAHFEDICSYHGN